MQDFLLKYLGATVAVALVIGPFFQGHMRPVDTVSGRAQMLSNMRYHTSVVVSLFHALGTLASSVRKLMKLGAFADRISELENSARALATGMFSCLSRHVWPHEASCNCLAWREEYPKIQLRGQPEPWGSCQSR